MQHTNGTSALKYPGEMVNETGYEMGNELPPEVDNMGDPIDWNVVKWEWKTASQVAELHDMTPQAVTYLCRDGQLRAVFYESRWRIEPESAVNYQKSGRTGRPPDKKV